MYRDKNNDDIDIILHDTATGAPMISFILTNGSPLGIWPGGSSLFAAELIESRCGGAANVDEVLFSFYTAGSVSYELRSTVHLFPCSSPFQ